MGESQNAAGRAALAAVLALLDLEPIEEDIFRGHSLKDRGARVYGGQVLGQALVAAGRTVPAGRVCHSLHAYFLRAGDPAVPILYEVDRSRDGHSFTARRVVAIQHGRQIFTLAASFQTPEPGFEHQFPMPPVPPPEALEDDSGARGRQADVLPPALRAWLSRARPFETRTVAPIPLEGGAPRPPFDNVWFRPAGPVPAWAVQALLAFASDAALLGTALRPHGHSVFDRLQVASIDHAMWFHRPFGFDDWLLYALDSPSASGARGFSRGAIYTREGSLVASVAQEGLIRER